MVFEGKTGLCNIRGILGYHLRAGLWRDLCIKARTLAQIAGPAYKRRGRGLRSWPVSSMARLGTI